MALNLKNLAFDEQGLVPAIIQDVQSKAVLMLGYMNEEALRKTVESGETWFWSRSRHELWHKGATSGNTQKVEQLSYDCDQDTLLILVTPQGPACHKQTYTCFQEQIDLLQEEKNEQREEKDKDSQQKVSNAIGNRQSNAEGDQGYNYRIFSQLIETIAQREKERPEGAYTTYLFEQGLDKILKKVGEEASEVIIASKNRDSEELRNESADLLYHLFVLWREQNLSLEQIMDILEQRHVSSSS